MWIEKGIYLHVSFHRVRIKNEPGYLPWFSFLNKVSPGIANFSIRIFARKTSTLLEIVNKKASFEYFIEARYVAGLSLLGTEVKSLREGKASFNDSYCFFMDDELFIRSLHIAVYAFGNISNHIPTRDRKLLLTKRELRKLQLKIKEKGNSIIPLRIFFSENGHAKIEIGLAKGKKHYDKRETIKERDAEREMRRKG